MRGLHFPSEAAGRGVLSLCPGQVKPHSGTPNSEPQTLEPQIQKDLELLE